MRKLIAVMNQTLDGYCDHDVMTADDETHDHYSDVIRSGGVLLYGRTTFQLMEYWKTLVEKPSGVKAEDEFAQVIDKVQKIVFSRTLERVDWGETILKKEINKEEILDLKKQSGKPILVGSPSLIVQFSDLGLVDEYQLAVHPVIVGKGLPLFKNIKNKVELKLENTKTFKSGVVIGYWERVK